MMNALCMQYMFSSGYTCVVEGIHVGDQARCVIQDTMSAITPSPTPSGSLWT